MHLRWALGIGNWALGIGNWAWERGLGDTENWGQGERLVVSSKLLSPCHLVTLSPCPLAPLSSCPLLPAPSPSPPASYWQ